MTRLLFIFIFCYLFRLVFAVECILGEWDYVGMRSSGSCTGELCVAWKWQTRSETLIKQGCLSGVDRGYTAKVGCRTNNLGAILCLCDTERCNTAELPENALSNQPVVRLPAVECVSKVTYSEGTAPDVVNVFNCADLAEFDFSVRLKSTSEVPGLYVNGCYKVQLHPKDSVTDCTCSRKHCNSILPIVQSGPVRCHVSSPSHNVSDITQKHFCYGDYCIMQKKNREFVKGCISVNERNSWSHIRVGHRHILGVDQWLCQSHLCNHNVQRAMKSIQSMRSHKAHRTAFAYHPTFPLGLLLALFIAV